MAAGWKLGELADSRELGMGGWKVRIEKSNRISAGKIWWKWSSGAVEKLELRKPTV